MYEINNIIIIIIIIIISPVSIKEELLPVVCEQRQTDITDRFKEKYRFTTYPFTKN